MPARITVAHPTTSQTCRVTRDRASRYLAGGWRIVWPEVPDGTDLDDVFEVAETGALPDRSETAGEPLAPSETPNRPTYWWEKETD